MKDDLAARVPASARAAQHRLPVFLREPTQQSLFAHSVKNVPGGSPRAQLATSTDSHRRPRSRTLAARRSARPTRGDRSSSSANSRRRRTRAAWWARSRPRWTDAGSGRAAPSPRRPRPRRGGSPDRRRSGPPPHRAGSRTARRRSRRPRRRASPRSTCRWSRERLEQTSFGTRARVQHREGTGSGGREIGSTPRCACVVSMLVPSGGLRPVPRVSSTRGASSVCGATRRVCPR